MDQGVNEMAYGGQWVQLLEVLRQHPEAINSASEGKGYTPLHQAAWHGANLDVVGALLALGADPTLRTFSKGQTAHAIAREKHPGRGDLAFLLADHGRSAAQLARKVLAENPDFFGDYDGNRVVCDRVIEALGSDSCTQPGADPEKRLEGAFLAVTGTTWRVQGEIPVPIGQGDVLTATTSFWVDRFLPAFRERATRSCTTPLERRWATVADLFSPIPESWGYRGDVFLWLEMRAALNNVPIPDQETDLCWLIAAQYHALTGSSMLTEAEVLVPRFGRGGMSSGMVSGEFWRETLVPLLQQRAKWLKASWSMARS